VLFFSPQDWRLLHYQETINYNCTWKLAIDVRTMIDAISSNVGMYDLLGRSAAMIPCISTHPKN
jgi:hypothetical protein